MCVHINREQLPYLCFVIRLCSCIILTQCDPEVSALGQCDSGICKFAIVPRTGCLEVEGFYLKLI